VLVYVITCLCEKEQVLTGLQQRRKEQVLLVEPQVCAFAYDIYIHISMQVYIYIGRERERK